MEDILKKANELGLLLKQSDVFNRFTELDRKLGEDSKAVAILDKYNEIAESIMQKQQNGEIIESYEKESFREITETVNSTEILREYLQSRDEYIDLLMKVHESLGDIGI